MKKSGNRTKCLFLVLFILVCIQSFQISTANAQEQEKPSDSIILSVKAVTLVTENIASNARLDDSRFYPWGTEYQPGSDRIAYAPTKTGTYIPAPSIYSIGVWGPKSRGISVEQIKETDNSYLIMRPAGPLWDPHVAANLPTVDMQRMRVLVTFDLKKSLEEQGYSYKPEYIKNIEIRTATGMRMAGNAAEDVRLEVLGKKGTYSGSWVQTTSTGLLDTKNNSVPRFSDFGMIRVSPGNNDLQWGGADPSYGMYFDAVPGSPGNFLPTATDDGTFAIRYSMSAFSVKYPGNREFWKVRTWPCMMDVSFWAMDSSSLVVEYSRGKIGALAQNWFFSGVIDTLNTVFDPAVVGTTMSTVVFFIVILVVMGMIFLSGSIPILNKKINKKKKLGITFLFSGLFTMAFIVFAIWAVSSGYIILDYTWDTISKAFGRGFTSILTGIMSPILIGIITLVPRTAFQKTTAEIQTAAIQGSPSVSPQGVI